MILEYWRKLKKKNKDDEQKMIPEYWSNFIRRTIERDVEAATLAVERLERYKEENKRTKNWIYILKIVLALTIMAIGLVGIGWFIGSIIAIKMECGG